MVASPIQCTKTTAKLISDMRGQLKAFLNALKPVNGSYEFWFKIGHDSFYQAQWNGSELTLWRSWKTVEDNPRSRVVELKPITNGLGYVIRQSRALDGGVFYIPTQPQGLPLKDCVAVTDDIGIEFDGISGGEQAARYAEWENITGLSFHSLISSGGKSLHGHLKTNEHLPVAQVQYLRRLVMMAMRGDPAVENLHQPIRIPGVLRKEKGNWQELIAHEPEARYTYEQMLKGCKCWFAHLGWRFPESIPDGWWKQLKRLYASSSKLSEEEKITKTGEMLEIGYVQEPKSVITFPNNQTRVDGDRQPSDILHTDILPRLSPQQIYKWNGHQFQWSGDSKARGCCPHHDSNSGTAFHIEPNGDGGEWLWECPSCGVGGGAVDYRHWLKTKQTKPRGKEFIEIVQELAREAGVELPKFNPHKPTYADSSGGGGGDGERRSFNRWNSPKSHNCEIGWWIEKEDENGDPIRRFIPKANFDFQVERELCSPNGDGDAGLVLKVKRSFDTHERRVVLRSLDRLRMVDFVAALTQAYGHDVVCSLKPEHLHALIHVRLLEYHQRGGKIYKLADRVGYQEDGFWVFPDRQFTPKGEPCTEEESGWVYNDLLTTGEDKIPEPVVAAPDTQALPRLVDAMSRFYGPEVIDAAVFCLGYGAASLHYQEVMKRERRFPILNPVGDPGSFKTLVAECALSLSGNHRNLISRSSESAIYERLKRSGNILQCWDDPQRSKELDELFKRLYNGEARCLRRVFQEPHAPLMATSNHALGDDQPATRSRVVSVPFYPSSAGDRDAWDSLKDAMDQASGALPQLIQLGYPAKEIRVQAQDLRSLLPLAHARVADSLGLVLWYAKAVARLAGYPEERLERYVKETLCAHANDAESNRSSLEDFLDKCQAAVAQSKIGGWNIRAVEDRAGKQFIAVHMPSVWSVVDKAFLPSYSRSIVESGILKAGGNKRGTQKFYRSEDETKTYLRACIQPQGENTSIPKEPVMVPRKCVVIPASLSWDLYEAIIPPRVEDLAVPEPELPQLPPVTTSCQGGGNSPNSNGEGVSSPQSQSVTKNKKESVLEKETEITHTPASGDIDGVLSSKKSGNSAHSRHLKRKR